MEPPNVRRHFLSWHSPLLRQAVEWLAGDWAGEGPLDLSDVLVIVPTRHSGRRLREALATYAAAHGTAVFPPRVMLPESLIAVPPAATDVASRLVSTLAWIDVLRALPLDDFRDLFPADPPAQNFTWGLRLADSFSRLQGALAESGLRAVDVVAKIGPDFPEFERWQQIADLEKHHDAKLGAAGLRDSQVARIATAREPQLDEGIARIIMMATPDALPLAIAALDACSRTIAIDVAVFAPATEAAAFDKWGRPLAEAWATRQLELPQFEERVQLCANPSAQANRVAEIAHHYGKPEAALGVGVLDMEVTPLLEGALEQFGYSTFNPEGRRREGDGFHQLLRSLAALASDGTFANVEALARCPDFLAYLKHRIGPTFSAAEFLRSLDTLHARYLPSNLAEARRHLPDSVELSAIAHLRDLLTDATFPENVTAVLREIFRSRRLSTALPAEAALSETIEVWMKVLRDIAVAPQLTRLTNGEWWELALQLYGESVRYDDKPAHAVELQGWLELLWEDAPHLIVAGLNDGLVPESIVGDPFLPESLRERLGLKTNASRFARDAYVLEAIASCRRGEVARPQQSIGTNDSDEPVAVGRLDLLVGKTSGAGDPLRPSRLLLRCADSELPRRINFLFREIAAAGALPPWRRAWKLVPPRVAAPERVAVTALRAWLSCPFRFYLSRVLRMEAVDPTKTELDALDFGTLCHTALEAMGRSPLLRDCTDPKTIREFLLAELDGEARIRFGRELTLPLLIQLESARQRLSRAADVQAQARTDGWVIESVEQAFELDVGGLRVSGKIDRIERHEANGMIRVIDYKTSDQPVEPWQAHLRGIRRDETLNEFTRFAVNGREHVWSDLQLPLYRRAVATGRINLTAGGGADQDRPWAIVCGYFNLPKAAAATGIRQWDDYTREHDDAAWRCATGVAAAIRDGKFWPPNESIRSDSDPFASLFHHGVADSVDWKPDFSAETKGNELQPSVNGCSRKDPSS